jgi:hypothetical protein
MFKDLPDKQRQKLREELYQLKDLPPQKKERSREKIHRRNFPNDQ